MNLARIINPGVPWWTAIICNGIAALALALLIYDPECKTSISAALESAMAYRCSHPQTRLSPSTPEMGNLDAERSLIG
jgi:hypothetical protein